MFTSSQDFELQQNSRKRWLQGLPNEIILRALVKTGHTLTWTIWQSFESPKLRRFFKDTTLGFKGGHLGTEAACELNTQSCWVWIFRPQGMELKCSSETQLFLNLASFSALKKKFYETISLHKNKIFSPSSFSSAFFLKDFHSTRFGTNGCS